MQLVGMVVPVVVGVLELELALPVVLLVGPLALVVQGMPVGLAQQVGLGAGDAGAAGGAGDAGGAWCR